MKGTDFIKTKQILWAKKKGLKLNGSQGNKGLPIYTETLEHNLFEPLSKENKEQFEAGDGGEINDTGNRPAKMRALHSSSAIGVNLFQYWNKSKKVNEIANACRLCNKANQSSVKIIFEKKYVIDTAFSFCPNIDVVIENEKWSKYKVFAIECKFSEAYGSYRHSGIDSKYLDLKLLWKDIPNIFELAKSISPDDKDFRYLHTAQLIKHILGLKKEYGKKAFRLLYLWYDIFGEESYIHLQEIKKFTEIVKADGIKFSSISYQELISNLCMNYYNGNEEYCNYISGRYL